VTTPVILSLSVWSVVSACVVFTCIYMYRHTPLYRCMAMKG
jgi:hypothetical protein